MNIGIELRQPMLGESGGLALLLRDMLKIMFEQHPEDRFIVFCTYFNDTIVVDAPSHVRVRRLATHSFFNDIDRIAGEEQIDVLFRSYPMEDDLEFPIERQVFLIPDIQHEIFPEFFASEVLRMRRKSFNRALARAGAIGTLSEHARQTLRDHPWTSCDDLFLISPALPIAEREHLQPGRSLKELALIPTGDFFLYPANLWPHKNHRRVLQAFDLFLQRTGRSMQFIFTGHPRGWAALKADFPALPIRHLGFVSPQLLRRLFERARALVFFSLFEGFGMPLLEAFDAGTPVICSDTTSLPEVGGDAILTCSPTDVQAMSELMARVVEDDLLRADFVARGRARLQHYTWERSCQNLHAALERVAHSARPVPADQRPVQSIDQLGDELPLVSIITPSYNQGRFLARTIDSVLKQSYPRIEYIVVDGCSTDATIAILESYGDRVQWISEPDRGQTDAINKGFARATGSIRAYLNSDDILMPGAVDTVVRHFLGHPGCDMLYGRAYYIDENDAITGMYNTASYSFERLMSENCICQPAAFWRGRVADIVGPLNDRLHYAMDYEYWLRIDRAGGRIEHIPAILAASRLYPQTKTLSARGAIFQEVFQVCQAQAGYIHKNYFGGLWHYRCWERKDGWPKRFRKVPKFDRIMARLHYRWYHRRRYTLRYIIKSLKYRIGRHKAFAPIAGPLERLWSYTSEKLAHQSVLTYWKTSSAQRAKSRPNRL